MLYSLRFNILMAMLAVAGVAIATITLVSALTTRVEFSRYVDVGNELLAERREQVVFSFLETAPEAIRSETSAVAQSHLGDNALTDGLGTQPKIIYLNPDNFRFFQIDSGLDIPTSGSAQLNDASQLLEVAPRTINFLTSPDGRVQVIGNGQPLGIYYVEPTDSEENSLAIAQSNFVESVTLGLVLAASLAGLVAIVLTFTLSRRILHPVAQLTDAAQRMKSGNLTQRVDIPRHGEIGELAHAFNSMAETLSRNESLRQTMVSDIAHELRTPLTNIRGYLEGIQDGVLEPDREIIDLVYEEAIWLNRIITDLQELVLAEAGQLRFIFQEIHVDDIIESAVAMYQPRARNRQITLTSDLPYKLPYVYADPKRTGQVIRNLLSNAVKYTPPGGKITVTAAAHLNHIEVRVSDTGNGISEEHIPFIFERFYRVDPSRSRDTGGAGLGLAIVKQLVEAQGGQIRLHSEVGKGTTFVFSVPIYRREHEPVTLDADDIVPVAEL